jgi:dihydrofolate synthase/folylpolyglutamate synthase
MLEWKPTQITIPLLGYHQVQNAATAYTALQVARQNGIEVNLSAIKEGFSKVSWPGRFEILQSNPVVVVDAAHNRDSALKLRMALDDYFPGKKVVMVFGASEDKDVPGMFAELLPRVNKVIATRSYHPRALEPESLVEIAHQFGKPVEIILKVEDAVEKALHYSDPETMVLVTGSIFIAGGARHTWYNQISDA